MHSTLWGPDHLVVRPPSRKRARRRCTTWWWRPASTRNWRPSERSSTAASWTAPTWTVCSPPVRDAHTRTRTHTNTLFALKLLAPLCVLIESHGSHVCVWPTPSPPSQGYTPYHSCYLPFSFTLWLLLHSDRTRLWTGLTCRAIIGNNPIFYHLWLVFCCHEMQIWTYHDACPVLQSKLMDEDIHYVLQIIKCEVWNDCKKENYFLVQYHTLNFHKLQCNDPQLDCDIKCFCVKLSKIVAHNTFFHVTQPCFAMTFSVPPPHSPVKPVSEQTLDCDKWNHFYCVCHQTASTADGGCCVISNLTMTNCQETSFVPFRHTGEEEEGNGRY